MQTKQLSLRSVLEKTIVLRESLTRRYSLAAESTKCLVRGDTSAGSTVGFLGRPETVNCSKVRDKVSRRRKGYFKLTPNSGSIGNTAGAAWQERGDRWIGSRAARAFP